MSQSLPAGSELRVRLQQTVSSFGSHEKDELRGVVITPVILDGAIVIPLGTQVTGTIAGVRRVGLGFAREAAWVRMTLDSVRLPNGQVIPMSGRVSEVDNARETVDDQGRIRGIRATASFSSVLSGAAVSAAALDPMLLAFGLTSSLSIFRIPESEIVLPPGAELRFVTAAPMTLQAKFDPAVPGFAGANEGGLRSVVRDLPFRTATASSNLPSDLTNLAVLGSEEAIRSAFAAAGWVETDALNARSTYQTMRSIMENQGYREAPMSTLLLDGQKPRMTYSKTLNTFFKRHHLRVFPQNVQLDGQPVWTASSTHDSGIGFAMNKKTFIHLIDENIDEERDKVVNDLILTGCAAGVEMMERPWAPDDASNATGDRLRTDRRIAVVKLNDCTNPVRADAPLANTASGTRPSMTFRSTRNAILTLRNDVLRGNIAYQGVHGFLMARGALFKKGAVTDEARKIQYGGETWRIVPGPQHLRQISDGPKEPSGKKHSFHFFDTEPQSYETFLEFSASGGYSRFGNDRFSNQVLVANFPLDSGTLIAVPLHAKTSLRPGYHIAVNATFNAHRHFSHELGFTYNRSKLAIDMPVPEIPPVSLTARASIRQFHYALLVHLRPNGKRFRPFLAGGGGFQMTRQTEDAARGGSSVLRFTFKEINILYNAFRFGGDPPLEGGGIFQPTLHYGGGIKYHLTRRLVFRADFRETLSMQPDFWTKSYPRFLEEEAEAGLRFEPGPLTKYGPVRQQRMSVGFGITF